MQDTPPRRRRPPPRDDGPSLPFIPIVLGVIVLGFVIGAGLSVAGHHGPPSDVALATSTPTFEATLAPATLAPAEPPLPRKTPAPTHRPAPSAPPRPAFTATPVASPSGPSPAVSVPATESAAPAAPSAAPAATDTPEPRPATPAAPPPKTAAPATPAAAPATATPVALASASATSAPPSSDDTTSDFGKLAAGVVRSYLAAVARGDLDGAYAQLGTSSDASGGALPEAGIVTRATRIVHVEARGGEDSVTVNVDMRNPNGAYFGQYTVHRTANGAATIVRHSIFKS